MSDSPPAAWKAWLAVIDVFGLLWFWSNYPRWLGILGATGDPETIGMTRFRMAGIFVLAFVFVSLAGCVTAYAPLENWEELPAVPTGMANIHFLRPASNAGSIAWPALLLNGQRRGILPSAAFTAVSVKPGAYRVSLENEQEPLSGGWPATTQIEVAADRRYFILLEVQSESHSGLAAAGLRILPLLPTSGEAIKAMRWIHLDEAEGLKQAKFLLYSPAPRQTP